jgi:ribosomal subunit interface protein
MDITISTRHCDISDQTKNYINREMAGLSKFHHKIIGADVILTTEKHRQIAEIKLKINSGTLFGKAESADVRTSFDQAITKLTVQLKKHKANRKGRKPSRELGLPVSSEPSEPAGEEEFLEEE